VLPLPLLITGANPNDSLMFEALLDDIPAVRTPAGRGRHPTEACTVTLIPGSRMSFRRGTNRGLPGRSSVTITNVA
jgi:hypothetical protein